MKKNNSLQILRAIAFLGIFTSHLDLTYLGGIGVEVFLILSGFLMYLRYSDLAIEEPVSNTMQSGFKFAKSKISKLYSLHIITLIAALPILVMNNIHKKYFILRMFSKIFLNIFLVQAWIPVEEFRYSLNNLSWYLCVCCLAYFLFPFIINQLKTIKTIRKIFFLSIGIVACQILFGLCVEFYISDIQLIQGLTYNFPLYRVCDFILGCNMGYFYSYYKKEVNKYKSILLFLTGIVVCFTIILVPKIWNLSGLTWCKNTVILIPAACLLVLSFEMIEWNERNKYITALIKLGDISAYTYLIHELVIRYINIFLLRVVSLENTFVIKLFVGVISFLITIILAFCFEKRNWRFYEVRKS